MKVLGLFKVEVRTSDGQPKVRHIILMEDLFFGSKVANDLRFDLKGIQGRHQKLTATETKQLLKARDRDHKDSQLKASSLVRQLLGSEDDYSTALQHPAEPPSASRHFSSESGSASLALESTGKPHAKLHAPAPAAGSSGGMSPSGKAEPSGAAQPSPLVGIAGSSRRAGQGQGPSSVHGASSSSSGSPPKKTAMPMPLPMLRVGSPAGKPAPHPLVRIQPARRIAHPGSGGGSGN